MGNKKKSNGEIVNALGVKFKATKSEKAFKEIYDRLRHGVINYYSNFGKDHQLVEDAYNEAMISFWSNIDTLNIEDYSVSTNIYLKTKQSILRQNQKKERTTGVSNFLYTSNNQYKNTDEPAGEKPTLCKLSKYSDAILSRITTSQESDYIEQESIDMFWDLLKNAKFYDIMYDHYFNGLKYKELSEKYNVDMHIVKNRIFHGKKQAEQLLNNNYEETYTIFN